MTLFAKTKPLFRLIWTSPVGELVSAYFETGAQLEQFSQQCVYYGLCPRVPLDAPTNATSTWWAMIYGAVKAHSISTR
jgi:hypothetical protein